jgi:hypothetical protein
LDDDRYIIWINKCYFIYLQHGSSKFMDVNSSVTPLKIATCAAKRIEIKIPAWTAVQIPIDKGKL